MPPSSSTADLLSLTEQLDELSTQLMVEGALAIEDLRHLALTASEIGNKQLADAAQALAATGKAWSKLAAGERIRRLGSGLEDLRKLSAPPPQPAVDPVSAPAADTNSLANDEDLIREFVTESGEHLVNIEGQMLILEQNAADTETLNAVFRAFHTIKGLAGFLEFTQIQALAHEVETLLDLARNGELTVTPSIVDVVLDSTDTVRRELGAIEARLAGAQPPASTVNTALLERIRSASRGVETPPPLEPLSALAPTPQAASTAIVHPRELVVEVPPTEVSRTEAPRTEKRTSESATVRIDTAKLDQLMDMVGEMVIAQTLIGHSPALATVTDARLLSDLSQLARITADVQRITTGMRMIPIGTQFQKTARVIRDLSRRAGKQIVFESSGEETEVDKSIAEEISDPLLHMVRNSIDHGIESPEDRRALGKDPTARIRLSAHHEAGQIVITISDDGRGLNREKILAKAIERGIVQAGAQLSDNEVFLLIFEAGFSTAEKVTDISGRGVGMDVVRRHVQALRGSIDIQSKAGQGTTFFLRLPLTLAIIEGLVVVVGDQRYIAPIFSVKEMFRPTPGMISTVQGTSEMVMVRGGLLPIVRLHQRFGKTPRTTILTEGTLIVAETHGRQFCLFVDDLVGKQEVVIKSLGKTFQHVAGLAGCAILGDGRVGLILDMQGIFKGRPL